MFELTSYHARYPRWMIGKPLLYSSSALASLGDAMFGYSQGIIASAQVQPSFIHRMYGKQVTLQQIQECNDGVNVFLQGTIHSSFVKIRVFNCAQPLSFLA